MSPWRDAPWPCCGEGGARLAATGTPGRSGSPGSPTFRPRREASERGGGGETHDTAPAPRLGGSSGGSGGARAGGGHSRHGPSRWAPAAPPMWEPGHPRPFPVLGQERVHPNPLPPSTPPRVGPHLPPPSLASVSQWWWGLPPGGPPGPCLLAGRGQTEPRGEPPAAQTLRVAGAGGGWRRCPHHVSSPLPVLAGSPSPPPRLPGPPGVTQPGGIRVGTGTSHSLRGGDGGDGREHTHRPPPLVRHPPPAPRYGHSTPRVSFLTPTSPNPRPAPWGDPGRGSREPRGFGGMRRGGHTGPPVGCPP